MTSAVNFEFCLFVSLVYSKDCSIVRCIVNTFLIICSFRYFYAQLCFPKCGCLRLFSVNSYFFYGQWTVFYQKLFFNFSRIEKICQCLSMTFLLGNILLKVTSNGKFSWVDVFSLACKSVFRSACIALGNDSSEVQAHSPVWWKYL